MNTTTLYRPVGQKENELIAASDWRAFPPRLPEQPIFYPVLNEAYATQIARDWNTKDPLSGHAGYVTRFRVRTDFLDAYEVHTVGAAGSHDGYWIPAEELDAFNAALVGPIEVIAAFHGETIFFYSRTEEYAWLSNFSPHGFEEDGLWWPTVEHYFQAQKFPDPASREKIRQATTPKEAKRLGRSRAHPIRPDWDAVRDAVMAHALRRKFETHPELRRRLDETAQRPLVENAPGDSYWGAGRTGSGQNRLGALLMERRAAYRTEPDDDA